LIKGTKLSFKNDNFRGSLYRPFVKMSFYYERVFVHRTYQLPKVFSGDNLAITISGPGSSKPFSALATDLIYSYDLLEKTQCLPLYRYTTTGDRVDNITDWALAQFRARYQTSEVSETSEVSRQDIFHYVYAVLHHPAYREKYAINLKREFPRIPFYDDFWQWAEWGKELMELHLNYEQAEPYPLAREDKDPESVRKAIVPRLMARKETGVIEVDTLTTLRGVPSEAWDYRLGTYSALEWVLERHKERTPKDPTIREKFNTYRFADYKEPVIDLLRRVCAVSVETMKIIRQMPG